MIRLCCTNKEALRWCTNRRAGIKFEDWKKIFSSGTIKNKQDLPSGVSCCVSLGRVEEIDKTLIQTVNKWIRKINNEKGNDYTHEISFQVW